MLKIVGTDIIIQSILTKTTWKPGKCSSLSAPAVVLKINGNTKNMTTGWIFWT